MTYYRFNGKHFVVIGLDLPISAIVLVLGVMVTFVSLLTACETCHGIVVSTFLSDVVGLSTLLALTNCMPYVASIGVSACCSIMWFSSTLVDEFTSVHPDRCLPHKHTNYVAVCCSFGSQCVPVMIDCSVAF